MGRLPGTDASTILSLLPVAACLVRPATALTLIKRLCAGVGASPED
jgi:hypothetical protein